jgi:hypothetical protein
MHVLQKMIPTNVELVTPLAAYTVAVLNIEPRLLLHQQIILC